MSFFTQLRDKVQKVVGIAATVVYGVPPQIVAAVQSQGASGLGSAAGGSSAAVMPQYPGTNGVPMTPTQGGAVATGYAAPPSAGMTQNSFTSGTVGGVPKVYVFGAVGLAVFALLWKKLD